MSLGGGNRPGPRGPGETWILSATRGRAYPPTNEAPLPRSSGGRGPLGETPARPATRAGAASLGPDLPRVDLEVERGRVVRLDVDVLARGRRDEPAAGDRLLPDDHLLGPGRDVLDLELPLVVGHREVGAVGHHPVRLHPGVDIADHL